MFKIKTFSKFLLLPSISMIGIFSSCGLAKQNTKQSSDAVKIRDEKTIPFEYFNYTNNYRTITGFASGITIQKIRQEHYSTIEIPYYVENIAPNAFSYMFDGLSTSVNKLVFGVDEQGNSSLTTIGSNAFQGCYGFSCDLDFTKTQIQYIGNFAFENCQGITNLKFVHDDKEDETLEEIGDSCFAKCSELQEIVLPETLQEIGSYAFDYCKSVVQIDLSRYVTPPIWMTKQGQVFRGCSKEAKSGDHSVLLNGLKVSLDIWKFLLSDEDVESSVLNPRFIRVTPPSAFKFNEKEAWNPVEGGTIMLRTYSIPDEFDASLYDVISVPADAEGFRCDADIPLTEFDILNPHPMRLQFEDSSKLQAINLNNGGLALNPYLVGELKIPDSVTEIYPAAFSHTKFSKVTLPDNDQLRVQGTAFYDSKINELVIPKNVFAKTNYFAQGAFLNCKELSVIDLQIPDGQTNIPWVPEGDTPIFNNISPYGGTILVQKGIDDESTRNKILSIKNQLSRTGFGNLLFDKYNDPQLDATWFITDEDTKSVMPDQLIHRNKKNEINYLADDFDIKKVNYSILQLPDNTTAINQNVFASRFKTEDKSWIFKPNFRLASLKNKCLAENSDAKPNSTSGLILGDLLPLTLKDMDNPFGEYNYNLRGVFHIPDSVVSLTNFSIEATNISGLYLPGTLKNVSSLTTKSPFYSDKLKFIDLTGFESCQQFEQVQWPQNAFKLFDYSSYEIKGQIRVNTSVDTIENWEETLSQYGFTGSGWELEQGI